MSYSSYNDPVRFEAPPPRQRKFPMWIVVVGIVVLLVVVGGLLLLRYLSATFRRTMQAALPPPAVHVGLPLAWRTLEHNPITMPMNAGTMGGLFVADFDADGDEEILRIGVRKKSNLFEVGGAKSEVRISGQAFMMGGYTWDYDRDGVSEIVIETMLGDVMNTPRLKLPTNQKAPLTQVLPVYDLDGNVVVSLPVVGQSPESIQIGDFDGDGFDDLLSRKPSTQTEYGSDNLIAFGKDGKVVWEPRQPISTVFSCPGDLDGDGLDELVGSASKMTGLEAIGKDTGSTTYSPAIQQCVPELCWDLDGDNTDEVLLSGVGFYNPVTNNTVKFTLPSQFNGGIQLNLSAQYAIGDFLGDSKLEIAMAEKYGNSYLIIFDLAGNSVYYEEFGDMVWAIDVAHSGGIDYLIVQLSEEVKIYP